MLTRRHVYSGVAINGPRSALDSTPDQLLNSRQRLGRDAMRLMQDRIGLASNALLFATCGHMIDRKPQRVIRELTVAEHVAGEA